VVQEFDEAFYDSLTQTNPKSFLFGD